MSDLTLTNEGAPVFEKPDPKAWIEATPLEKNCQAIYSHLQKIGPDSIITLNQIIQALHISRMSAFWAARKLVLSGFALREDVKIETPTKKNPRKFEMHIALRFVPPWQPKRGVKWPKHRRTH